jgi:phosphatidylinositol alpha 1,6-mannosyltransferase
MNAYVALGDSFTAGTGCQPGEGWADRVALALARRRPGFEYENFAVDGATSADVRNQVCRALQLEPDLVSVVCGTNDLLYGRLDPLTYSRNFSAILTSLRRALPGVHMVTATAPERWDFLPLGPRTRTRLESELVRLNHATRALAEANDVAVLDVAGHPGLSQPENFAGDGLHPSPLGHRRAAEAFGALISSRFDIPIQEEALQ